MTKNKFPRGRFSPTYPRPHVQPNDPDALPPHSIEAEQGALGCALLGLSMAVPGRTEQSLRDESQAEVDALLLQLKPGMFYDLRHQEILTVMHRLRMDNRTVSVSTVSQWLKDHKKLEAVGGVAYVAGLPDMVPSFWEFPIFLETLKDKQHRRWLKAKSVELNSYAAEESVTLEATKERLAELFDATQRATSTAPMIEFVTPKEAKLFIPDPADFLIGDGLIQREAFHTFGGEPGCGKSRMGTTLAVAGARGTGSWLGYPVRRKFRTLVLQTENTGNRLKEELSAVPAEHAEGFRVANKMPHGMAFGDAEFRRFVGRQHEKEPFDVLIVDPWNDVVAEDGQSDYAEALANIRRCFTGRKMPAIIIVAHMRKMRSDASGTRKGGRALLHELSGSLKLGSTSRSVFAVQPVSPDMDDDRIVIEIAKANDVSPEFFSRYGRRAAFHRRNAVFEPCKDFNWDEWDNPAGNNSERRAITIDMVREVMGKTNGMRAGKLVTALAEKFDVGESTVWRAIREGSGYLSANLKHAAGSVCVTGGAA